MSRRDSDFDGEHEPEYTPATLRPGGMGGLGNLLDTIGYERFKVATWRTFREHTGHWPVLSIIFHYAAIVSMGVGIWTLIWIGKDREWSTMRSVIIGGSTVLFFIVAFLLGESVARKLDWKLFGNQRR